MSLLHLHISPRLSLVFIVFPWFSAELLNFWVEQKNHPRFGHGKNEHPNGFKIKQVPPSPPSDCKCGIFKSTRPIDDADAPTLLSPCWPSGLRLISATALCPGSSMCESFLVSPIASTDAAQSLCFPLVAATCVAWREFREVMVCRSNISSVHAACMQQHHECNCLIFCVCALSRAHICAMEARSTHARM